MMRRSKHAIISQILELCQDGALKTKIVYQANLNFRTVNPYIDLLLKNDLIEVKNRIYITTEKGMNLVNNFHEIDNELTES